MGKYAKRKSRFKRSDGSTSSDTTSNSFVRQTQLLQWTLYWCLPVFPETSSTCPEHGCPSFNQHLST
ncbi:hypothetical protein ATANTOWER_020802 [Ataeniobius toweri]|uniref:Uncharacterized protein n=1 Tax=Ataeniobius toweri TaxID=208326 RepID=A0ABU7BUE6_9TELE|nr:hypothetical protein [Ataeniobius toweri]